MVISCRHCYPQPGELEDTHKKSYPSYMGMFVYGRAKDLKGMLAAVEQQDLVPDVTIW